MAKRRPPPAGVTPPDRDLDDLVDAVLAGESAAWRELLARVHPIAVALCRRRRLVAGAASDEDAGRDVAVRALDRIERDDFAALRRYASARARYPSSSFVKWLSVVVANTAIDYLRALPEYQRRRVAAARSLVAIDVEPIGDRPLADPTCDPRRTVELRRVVGAFMDPAFPDEQRSALLLWLDGHRAGDIAAALGLAGDEEARRLLRAARRRLRRRFEEETR